MRSRHLGKLCLTRAAEKAPSIGAQWGATEAVLVDGTSSGTLFSKAWGRDDRMRGSDRIYNKNVTLSGSGTQSSRGRGPAGKKTEATMFGPI